MNTIIRNIDGKVLPAEASIVHDVMTVDKGSGNNLNGNMIRTILGEKDKITIEFAASTKTEMDNILAFFRSSRMVVTHESYWNSNEIVTQPMYHGDMSKEVMSYYIRDRLYYSITIELISYNVRKIKY